jgi:ribonuclease HI
MFPELVGGAHAWIQVQTNKGLINILNAYYPVTDKAGVWVDRVEEEKGTWVVVGDFNSRSSVWEDDCPVENVILRDKIVESQLVLMNDGTPTRVPDQANHKMTAIDLTLVTPDIAGDVVWEVGDDPLSSDHLPITTSIHLDIYRENKSAPAHLNYEKADWEEFRKLLGDLEVDQELCCEDLNRKISDDILRAATASIPNGGGPSEKKNGNSWWSAECKEAVKNKRKAYKTYRKYTNPTNHQLMIETKLECKRIIAKAKQNEWKHFVYELEERENLNVVYNKVKQMKGIYVQNNTKLVDNGNEFLTNISKADKLVEEFAKVSSFDGLPEKMKEYRRNVEKENLKEPPIDPSLKINENITLQEVTGVINNIKKVNVSEGPDGISYRMLKEVPHSYMKNILCLFEKCWINGTVPLAWKTATVTPIPKAGKPRKNPSSYRPISLTSHLGKIYERIVKERLNYYCESKGVIPRCQAGFRKGRGVSDHLAKLAAHVRRARARRRVLFACLFDVRRAYDTVWHRKLLQRLGEIGLSGRVYYFVKDFLKDRHIKVKWGTAISQEKRLEMGVPQGSVIAPLLFNIVLADIDKEKLKYCTLMVYADDVAVSFETRMSRLDKLDNNPALKHALNIFQKQVNGISAFMQKQGFTLSPSKTQFLIVKARQGPPVGKNITILIDDERVAPKEEVKYLGITFSACGSWTKHINQNNLSGLRALNIIKMLATTPWASPPKTMVILVQSLVRSRLIFGFEAFYSAPEHLIHRLEITECKALKIALGLPSSAPNYLVYRDAGLLPLGEEIRRRSASYIFRCQSVQNSTSLEDLSMPKRAKRQQETAVTDFVAELVAGTELQDVKVAERKQHSSPPWNILSQPIHVNLGDITKQDNPTVTGAIANEIIDLKYKDRQHIYTDGSRSQEGVGAAFLSPGFNYVKKYNLPDVSIFSAELIAILMALHYIKVKNKDLKWVILSDSKSALEALQSDRDSPREDIIRAAIGLLSDLRARGTEVILQWIPAHVGIKGNERADKAAKEAARGEGAVSLNIPLSYTDINNRIKHRAWGKWGEAFRDTAAKRAPLDPTPPTREGVFFPPLPRAVEHVIYRLRSRAWRTRHVGVKCSCGEELSPQHIIFHCERHRQHFMPLISMIGGGELADVVTKHTSLGWKPAITAAKLLLTTSLAQYF